jgi:hypothetical protein
MSQTKFAGQVLEDKTAFALRQLNIYSKCPLILTSNHSLIPLPSQIAKPTFYETCCLGC